MTSESSSAVEIYRRGKPLSTQHPLWHEAFYPKETLSHQARKQSIALAWDALPVPWDQFFASATESEFIHVLGWLYASPSSAPDYLMPAQLRPTPDQLTQVLVNKNITESGLSRIGAYRSMTQYHLEEALLWIWILCLHTYNTSRPSSATESPAMHAVLALLRRIPKEWTDHPLENNHHIALRTLRNDLLCTLMRPSQYATPDLNIQGDQAQRRATRLKNDDTLIDITAMPAEQDDFPTLRQHIQRWIQTRTTQEINWYQFVYYCMGTHKKDVDYYIHAIIKAMPESPMLWEACEEEEWRTWLLTSTYAPQWSELVFIKAWHGHLLSADEIACQPTARALYHQRHTPVSAETSAMHWPSTWTGPLALAKSGTEFWHWIQLLAKQDASQMCELAEDL